MCSFCTPIRQTRLPAGLKNTHNYWQMVFDPGLTSHSEVAPFSRCQSRFLLIFSPRWIACLFSSIHHFGCCPHPCSNRCVQCDSQSLLPPSSPARYCLSFSLCFCFHLLLPVLPRSSHMGHGHLQTRHHDHLTQQTHRGGGQLLQGQRACDMMHILRVKYKNTKQSLLTIRYEAFRV